MTEIASTSADKAFAGTMAVRKQHAFDYDRLCAWMEEFVPGFEGPLEVEQFRGGQSNPTYRLASPNGSRYVLRRKPPGVLLPSAHAVDREYRVMKAVAGHVPVPRVLGYCDSADVIGTPFFVMECVEGQVFWDSRLPDQSPETRIQLFDSMNAGIAAIHALDPEAVGLGNFGRPGNYVARQIARWTKQYRASETKPIEAMDKLIEWLPQNLPESQENSLVHGDFRLDNLIFHATEPNVVAVLDWELSTLGDPIADFTYNAMTWRLPPDPLRGFEGIAGGQSGIPTEADYVAAYCRRTGRATIPHYDFYIAYNLFRLAAILQGVRRRFEEGNAASDQARRVGACTDLVGELGWQTVQEIDVGT